jgi:hypothetical protein
MSQWAMLLGGRAMPREAFVHASDAATAFAHGQLIVNFAVDVGGYGVLGLFVSWMIPPLIHSPSTKCSHINAHLPPSTG